MCIRRHGAKQALKMGEWQLCCLQQGGRGLSEKVTFIPGPEKGKGRKDLTTGGTSSQTEGMVMYQGPKAEVCLMY